MQKLTSQQAGGEESDDTKDPFADTNTLRQRKPTKKGKK